MDPERTKIGTQLEGCSAEPKGNSEQERINLRHEYNSVLIFSTQKGSKEGKFAKEVQGRPCMQRPTMHEAEEDVSGGR